MLVAKTVIKPDISVPSQTRVLGRYAYLGNLGRKSVGFLF